MQSRAMVILLSLLGCGLGSEARAETLPDVMVGLSLSIPFPKAPVRVGVQARGGPYFLDWTTGLLLRTGGRTFVDVGKDGVRFGLTGYGGWGWGDDWQPGIAVDAEGGFVVGSHRVPSGWVAGGRLEGGRLVRGSIGYQRIFPFAKSEHAPVETLDVSLGASPISQVVWIVGRALRVNGEPQVAPVLGAQFAHRCAEADQRLKEAAEELAAVSTFIRTALELEALGAPAALVARCMGAAREEVHHLRDQLLLAGRSGLDAAHLEVLDPEPRRFGSRSEALCALATESWVDGWFGERQALNAIRRLRDSASDDQVARIWHAVGEEEASHVRLSGDIVDWCVKEGGSLVRAALRAA